MHLQKIPQADGFRMCMTLQDNICPVDFTVATYLRATFTMNLATYSMFFLSLSRVHAQNPSDGVPAL